MEKRYTFKCWNCQRVYTFLHSVEGQPKLQVFCPFCEQEGVVDLAPYRSTVTNIYQADQAHSTSEVIILPDVIPTFPPEKE